MSLLRNQASELVSFGRSIFLVDMGLYDNPLRPKEELELELKKLEKMEMDLLKVMFFLKEKLSEARINNFDLRQLEEHISNMSK
jgi:hypothetical protein